MSGIYSKLDKKFPRKKIKQKEPLDDNKKLIVTQGIVVNNLELTIKNLETRITFLEQKILRLNRLDDLERKINDLQNQRKTFR